ncbi:hypothetical protein [Nannocystis sp. SCPEA4]|uniref:WD40/YVTN/BNR-like repeat-containing protein n=1 Tax=Nannocystis sp. SCPEA4 TaxID=2996787 RepID=UPI002271D14F|nr:hypothetical protein [Nannocystis sp. SCPEA4]MCY1060111.1 hypothetical protein [Nannocystis sp. SCPEA4]
MAFTLEASGTEATLRDVDSAGDGVVVAVGDGGVILTRSPEGVWVTRKGNTTSDLSAVASHVASSQVLLTAVGAGGTIVVSDDGGLNWEIADSGVTVDLHDVAWGSGTVAVGDGVILRRDGFGRAWTPVGPSDGVGSLRAVASLDSPGQQTRFVAVGDGGAVFLSTDGGVGWIQRDAGTTADLRAAGVYRGGGGLGFTPLFWVAGVDGTARAMLDGTGERWETVDLGLDADVVGITPESDWLLASDGSLLNVGGTLGPSDPLVPPEDQIAQHRLFGIGGSFDEAWLVGEAGTIVRAGEVLPSCLLFH